MIESTNLVDDEHVSEPQIALPSGARVNLFVFELIMRLVDQGRAVFLDDRQDVIVRPDAGVHPDLLWSLTASRQDVRRIVDELITPLEEGESRAPVGDANRESLPRGPRTKQRHSSQRIDELWRRPRPYSWRDRVPRRG